VLGNRLGPAPQDRESQVREPSGVPAEKPTDPEAYVGSYYSTELDVEYRIDVSGNELRVRAGAGIDEVLFQIAGDTLATGEPLPGDRLDPDLVLRFQRNGSAVTGFELDAGRVVHLRFRRVSDEP